MLDYDKLYWVIRQNDFWAYVRHIQLSNFTRCKAISVNPIVTTSPIYYISLPFKVSFWPKGIAHKTYLPTCWSLGDANMKADLSIWN